MSDKELFEKHLVIFNNANEAKMFFSLVTSTLEKYNLVIGDPRLSLTIASSGVFALSAVIGKQTILSVKRNKIGLNLFLLLPRDKLNEYNHKDSIFLGTEDDKRKKQASLLVSFDLTRFNLHNYNNVLDDWQVCIKNALDKYTRSKSIIHNSYFYEVVTRRDVLDAVLDRILQNNKENDNEKVYYHEREIEEEEESISYDFDPDNINVITRQRSLDTLISRLKSGEIDSTPDFQRSEDLWNAKTMSRLIESILLNLPLPAFYFDASDKDYWIVIDGLQRLSTLRKFIVFAEDNHEEYENRLVLKGLGALSQYNDKDYNELPSRMKRRISEFDITLYLIQPGTDKNVKYSIFHRVNTGGLRLNAQEIRNALNQGGEAPWFLKRLSELESFRRIVGIPSKRMQDRELSLRFIAHQILPSEDYKGSISRFLDQAIEELNKKKNEFDNLKQKFEQALILSEEVFGEHVFSKSILSGKNDFNSSLYDVWMYYFALLNQSDIEIVKRGKKRVIKDFKNLLSIRSEDQKDFYDAITTASTDTTRVERRFAMIAQLLENYIPDFSYHWKQESEKNDQ